MPIAHFHADCGLLVLSAQSVEVELVENEEVHPTEYHQQTEHQGRSAYCQKAGRYPSDLEVGIIVSESKQGRKGSCHKRQRHEYRKAQIDGDLAQ